MAAFPTLVSQQNYPSNSLDRLLGGRDKTSKTQAVIKSTDLKKSKKIEVNSKKQSLKENSTMTSGSSNKKKNKKSSTKKGKSKPKSNDLTKGLSPPKDIPKARDFDDSGKGSEHSLSTFDKTQWERTRWGEEYSHVGGSGMSRAHTRQKKSTGSPKMSSNVTLRSNGPPTDEKTNPDTGKLIPGEARQIEQVRGEHLRRKPMFILILLAIEGIMCAVTMTVWGAAAENPLLPYLLLLINLLVVFSFICAGFFIELCRFQVKKDEEGSKAVARYNIPYIWRFILFGGHLSRAFLLCCCITIAAMDNDFDDGSIAVLAMQPAHLLLVLVQIIIVLRGGRRKE